MSAAEPWWKLVMILSTAYELILLKISLFIQALKAASLRGALVSRKLAHFIINELAHAKPLNGPSIPLLLILRFSVNDTRRMFTKKVSQFDQSFSSRK